MPTAHAVVSLLVLFFALSLSSGCADPVADDVLQRSRTQPEWFKDAKLGIFIHWGLPSVPAFAAGRELKPGDFEQMLLGGDAPVELPYAEWYLNSMHYVGSKTEAYHRQQYGDAPYTDFKAKFEASVNQTWDPDAWASLFYQAGAKYVVLVAKHHDGYALWPSAIENPNIPQWSSPRDLVGELAAAIRARGMKFGIYYSTGLDWSFQLVTGGNWVMDSVRSAPSSQEYADYAYRQIVELIDRYQPDVLWADIGYPSRGRRSELLEYYFEKVPQGTVNDRWEAVDSLGRVAGWPGGSWVLKKLGGWALENKPDELEDDPDRVGFKTTEYSNLSGIAPFIWESTRGLGGSFGYNKRETADDMLSSPELVEYLVDTVSKNGNVLLNVGPDSSGTIPAIQRPPLAGLGEWLTVNGEAIYGTRPWTRFKNKNGRALRYTYNDNALYAIVLGSVESSFEIESPGIDYLSVQVLGGQVTEVVQGAETMEFRLEQAINAPAVVVRYALR